MVARASSDKTYLMKSKPLLITAILVTILIPQTTLGYYCDIPEDHPNFVPIKYLTDRGIVGGYFDNTFKPKIAVTIAEALKITLESAKPNYFSGKRLESLKNTKLPYENISQDEWSYPYIAYAYQQEILPDSKNFDQNKKITREKTVKLLLNAHKRKTEDKVEILFGDVPPDNDYYPYFAYVYLNNIALPTDENYYKPDENISREEIAVLNYRLIFEGRLQNTFQIIPTKIHCKATFYSDFFDGKETANGEIFSQNLFTAASLTLPFDTKLKITHQETGESIYVKVNDRGPYDDRFCLDLSRAAFETFADTDRGWVWIDYEIIE